MAEIRINIPGDHDARVMDAFCKRFGYQEVLRDGTPNPQTKRQFAKAKLIEFIMTAVRDQEATEAAETARKAKQKEVDDTIQLS